MPREGISYTIMQRIAGLTKANALNIGDAGTSCSHADQIHSQRASVDQSMIPLLEPIFQGDLAPLGETLQCSPEIPTGALHVADLVQSPEVIADILHRHAAFWHADVQDLRAVASAWTLRYLGLLLPPLMAGASILQHVFPAAAEQMWGQLDAHGTPVRFHVQHLGSSRPRRSTAERYAPLLGQHLDPLFATLVDQTRVASKILWGNTARHLETILDQASALTGGAATIAQDKQHLLNESAWPQDHEAVPTRWTGINPLHGPQREVIRIHGQSRETMKLFRQCCLYHMLPGVDYCGACPLAPQHRKLKAEAPDV